MAKKLIWLNILVVSVVCLYGCESYKAANSVTKVSYGQKDGKEVFLYTLTNSNGLRAKISNYGGLLISIEIPDRDGKLANIIVGEDLEDLMKDNPHYYGGLIGRFGNRIAKGKFSLDGVEYTTATNDGENHLHGGIKGFHKVVWDGEPVVTVNSAGLKLSYLSKDGEEGYPGNLNVVVTFTLNNDNEFKIEYEAQTDKKTIVNLTSHGYYNIGGHKSGDTLSHEIMFNADYYHPVDEGLIPTGEFKSVKGTPFDLTRPTPFGRHIARLPEGYDHNFVLNRKEGQDFVLALSLYDPKSGRYMEIHTTEPGLQFYSGNFMDGTTKGKDGARYKRHQGLVLETQHFPDSPNQPGFPSVVLNPGEKYRHVNIHKFWVK